jgi:ABC-type transport system involved in cytochrome c biogenesis permease subunit
MITQLMLGIVAMVMQTSDFQPAGTGPKRVATPAEDSLWKPAVEVAMGGMIVVIAVGARLALAYGWLN